MDFLDKLVIPQSSEHIQLLHYLLMLILFLFIPFMSAVFGSTILSLYYKAKGFKESNNDYLRFSKDVIETLTINKSIGLILGIVPIITTMLIYTQLLQGTNSNVSTYLIFSTFFMSIGLILIYTYRYSMTFMRIYDAIKSFKPEDDSVAREISRFRKANIGLSGKSGRYGLAFIFIGMWLFISSVTVAAYPEMWGKYNIIYLMFSWEVLAHLFSFLSSATALTGAAIFFAFFYWEGGKHLEEGFYSDFVKKTATRVAFTGALLMPLFMMIDIFAFPSSSLSGAIFFFATIALILLFIAYHFLYSMIKNKDLKYSGTVFYMILFTLLALIIKDQLVLQNSTEVQTAVMNVNFEKMMAELTGEGNAAKAISGEQIYKNICSSCHSFDHKVVGPPYEETLPKYEGHIDRLIAFIRNPVQNNPGYPPMPNPGLTPVEADSIAHYIMRTYKQK
jgi:cytochrome c